MRRPFAFIVGTIALALGACSQDAPERAPGDEASAPAATAVPTGAVRQDAAVAPDRGGYASAYTKFDLAACRVTGEDPEGASVDYACPGYADVPLVVHLGDGRFDLDAGVDSDEFMTIGAFNELGERLEWRTKDGAPFAVIFRYRDVAPQGEGRTVLAVETIGGPGAPGCRVAHIAGDTPDANRVAREIADTVAEGFRCGTDEMRVIGDAR